MAMENEGKRAVYRSVKSYLAKHGFTREEIRTMIQKAVREEVAAAVQNQLSDSGFVVNILRKWKGIDLYPSVEAVVRRITENVVNSKLNESFEVQIDNVKIVAKAKQ